MMDITTPNTEERGNTTAADLAGRITAARDAEGDLIISTDDGQEVLIRNYSDPTTNIEIILPDDSRIDGMTAATWMAQIGAVIAKGGIEPNQTSELETSLRPASVKLDSTVLDEDIADDRAHKDAIAEFETAAGYDEGKYQPAPDLPADDQSDFGQRSAESLSRVFASREELGRPANDSDTPIRGRTAMAERRQDEPGEMSLAVNNDDSEQIPDEVDSILEEIMGIKLHGGRDHDELLGTDGNDVLNGRNGDDNIIGFDGNDRLYGSNGADDFLF